MKTRKLIPIVIAMIILTATSLTACFEYSDWLTVSQRKVTDAAMQRLCDGISRRDADAVKAEFRYVDILNLPDFDESVQKLFDYITGENITFKRTSSGCDEKAMGSYPKSRYFGGCTYEINTTTDSYKVCCGYWSYYSERQKNFFDDEVNHDKMGFDYFDIINKKNDRDVVDKYYTGCIENKLGINFDYKTIYLSHFTEGDTFEYEKIYCDVSQSFDPIIINSTTELISFYEQNSDFYTLDSRPDGRGYADVITKYDEEFFAGQSIYLVGIYNNGGGFMYVPQWLYIGDFVMVDIASFEYGDFRDDFYDDDPFVNGVIISIELPEKVASDIDVKIKLD